MRKINSKIYGKFYSPEHILSYNKPFMISIGSRSIGKSTGWAIFLLKNFEKNRQMFMYLRRRDDELLLTCRNFFDNAVQILKNSEDSHILDFKYENRRYYIKFEDDPEKWIYCGYCMPLSLCEKYKSGLEGEFYYVLYDEFISQSKNYIGGKNNFSQEYEMIVSLYCTLDRKVGKAFRDEVRFIFLGNNSSYYNPVMIGLGVTDYIRTNSKLISPKNKKWVVEQIDQVEATSDFEKTTLYQITDEVQRNYNFKNKNDDITSFCEKITDPLKPLFNISYSNNDYGVYYCERKCCVYISKTKNSLKTFALTLKNQDKINYTLVMLYRENESLKILKKAFDNGDLYFENPKIKFDMINYFKLTY